MGGEYANDLPIRVIYLHLGDRGIHRARHTKWLESHARRGGRWSNALGVHSQLCRYCDIFNQHRDMVDLDGLRHWRGRYKWISGRGWGLGDLIGFVE